MKRVFFIAVVVFGLMNSACSNDLNGFEQEDFVLKADLTVEEGLQAETHELVNSFRRSQGFPELNFNEEAYKAALEHTQNMAVKGVMSHAQFTQRAQKLAAKVNAVEVAENLSRNYPTAQATFNGWLNSPGHKANIAGDFTHTAVAVLRTTNGDVYYTQIFFKVK